ncbi:MAG: hypothetical protein ACTSUC_09805 [Promethearchaeota archaeon]
MAIHTNLINGLNNIIGKAGDTLLIKYYTIALGSVWDDDTTLSDAGSLWISGVVMPLDKTEGSQDSVLLEQGKLIDQDKRIYIHGSIAMTGSERKVSIQVGSPTGEEFSTIPIGGQVWEVQGKPVYKKQYIRRLTGDLS